MDNFLDGVLYEMVEGAQLLIDKTVLFEVFGDNDPCVLLSNCIRIHFILKLRGLQEVLYVINQ